MRLYFRLQGGKDCPELPKRLAIDTEHQVYSYEVKSETEHLWIKVNTIAMRILLMELDFCCFSYSADLSAIDPAELEPEPEPF